MSLRMLRLIINNWFLYIHTHIHNNYFLYIELLLEYVVILLVASMSYQHYNDFLNRPGGHHKRFSDWFTESVPSGLSEKHPLLLQSSF